MDMAVLRSRSKAWCQRRVRDLSETVGRAGGRRRDGTDLPPTCGYWILIGPLTTFPEECTGPVSGGGTLPVLPVAVSGP